MKLFKWCKDGGPESNVSGLFFIEIKSLFTIALLRFDHGSRDAYHSHAFHSVSWLLKGGLQEFPLMANEPAIVYRPSLRPIFTWRSTFHRVYSFGTSYVLTFRGPWTETWNEYISRRDEFVTLTHGRKVQG